LPSRSRTDHQGPVRAGGTRVEIFLFVEDVEASVRRGKAAGVTVRGGADEPVLGDCLARQKDPLGHDWLVDWLVEDLRPDEIEARCKALFAGAGVAAGG
jgi:PhnB protein